MKPPMIPNAGREVDAVNFRSVKESESVDIGAARVPSSMRADLETPGEREVDPFEEFNSGMCGFFFFSFWRGELVGLRAEALGGEGRSCGK
jgi:hypothetical protein